MGDASSATSAVLEAAETALAQALDQHTAGLAERETALSSIVGDTNTAASAALQAAESSLARALEMHLATLTERENGIGALLEERTAALAQALGSVEGNLGTSLDAHVARIAEATSQMDEKLEGQAQEFAAVGDRVASNAARAALSLHNAVQQSSEAVQAVVDEHLAAMVDRETALAALIEQRAALPEKISRGPSSVCIRRSTAMSNRSSASTPASKPPGASASRCCGQRPRRWPRRLRHGERSETIAAAQVERIEADTAASRP